MRERSSRIFPKNSVAVIMKNIETPIDPASRSTMSVGDHRPCSSAPRQKSVWSNTTMNARRPRSPSSDDTRLGRASFGGPSAKRNKRVDAAA